MTGKRRAIPVKKPSTARGWLIAAAVGVAVLVGGSLLFGQSAAEKAQAQPGPHIQLFATALQGEVHKPLPTPETFSHGPDINGCDVNYGNGRQCLPVNFPPEVRKTVAAKCAWLKKEGFGSIEVRGTDAQGLVPAGGPKAPDGFAYACPKELGTT